MGRHPKRRNRQRLQAFLSIAWLLTVTSNSMAQPDEAVGKPYPSWTWVVAQTLPSPQWVIDSGQSVFGARWQLTPILYSFGIHRSQSPWRFIVVEPIVRQSGSLELYVSPEYIALGDDYFERLGLRSGLRSYFPLIERGDYLSLSLGTSALRFQGTTTAAYEVGAHSFFGFLGLLVSYSPTPQGSRIISTLQIRFF